MHRRRRFIAISGSAAPASSLALPSKANVIDRNARIMVGFPAESSPDYIARLLADQVRDYAPSIIVDNRPGAGGRLPLDALKSSARDGLMKADLEMWGTVVKQTGCCTSRQRAFTQPTMFEGGDY